MAKCRCQGEEGIVDFVILFPVLILVIFVGFEFVLRYEGAQEAAQVARQAVAAAAAANGGGATAGQVEANRVLGELGTGLLQGSKVTVTGSSTTSWTVRVDGTAESLVSILPSSVSASASAPAERFQVGP